MAPYVHKPDSSHYSLFQRWFAACIGAQMPHGSRDYRLSMGRWVLAFVVYCQNKRRGLDCHLEVVSIDLRHNERWLGDDIYNMTADEQVLRERIREVLSLTWLTRER